MQSQCRPKQAYPYNPGVIHLQSGKPGAPDRCSSDDGAEVLTPTKMYMPNFKTPVEQSNSSTGERNIGRNSVAFGVIANRASQA
jgi:hypothetical protein